MKIFITLLLLTGSLWAATFDPLNPTVNGIMVLPKANPIPTGQLTVPNGTAAAPPITTTSDPNTGVFFTGSDVVGFSVGGMEAGRFLSTGHFQFNGAHSITTSSGFLSLNPAGNLALGTVVSGAWNGTSIGLVYGGTAANLSSVVTGGLIYKGAASLLGTAALTGLVTANGASAPTAATTIISAQMVDPYTPVDGTMNVTGAFAASSTIAGTGANFSGLGASQLVTTDGSKNLASAAAITSAQMIDPYVVPDGTWNVTGGVTTTAAITGTAAAGFVFGANGALFSTSDGSFEFRNNNNNGFSKLGFWSDLWLVRNSAGNLAIADSSTTPGTGSLLANNVTVNGFTTVPSTIITPGTTGAATINKMSGRVNMAALGTSVVITDSIVTANSIIVAMAATNDSTCVVKNVVAAAGSFTINVAAATAETAINFIVITP